MSQHFFRSIRESFAYILSKLVKKRLKVGIVCHPYMGGSGIAARSIAESLSRKGNEIHVITYDQPFRINKSVVKLHMASTAGEAVFQYFPLTLTMATKIAEVALREKLDIINVHYALPYSVAAYLAKMMIHDKRKIKVITTVHGSDAHTIGKKKEFREVVKFALENSDGITTVSRFLEGQIRDFGIDNHIEVINNEVKSHKFIKIEGKEREDLRKQFVKEDERLIIHLSNFRKVKRIGDLIRAFSIISKKVKCKLLMLGAGPEKKKMMNLVKRLKLTDKVIFVGKKKKVEKYLGIADLFLLTSEKEGFPLSILEAMSCEVPTVATKVGGIPELVASGKTGYLVEKGDVRAIAEKSISILSSKRKIERMGKVARDLVMKNYTPKKISSKYEKYFRRVLFGG